MRSEWYLPALLCLSIAACGGSGDSDRLQSAISVGRLDTVEIEVQSDQGKLIFEPGESWQFLAISTNSKGVRTQISEPVDWSSSDERLATITRKGVATMGTPEGVEEVTIRADFGQYSDTLTVSVSSSELVSLQIEPARDPLPECQNTEFSATGMYADGSERPLISGLNWSTDNSALASFSDTLLRTFDSGPVNALASTSNNISGVYLMTLTDTLTAINPSSGTELMLFVDDTETLTADADYSDGSTGVDITGNSRWTSDDTAIATVDDGQVTAVSLGSATLTVSCGGLFTEIAVDVVEVDDIEIVDPLPGTELAPGEIRALELYRQFSNEDLDTEDVAADASWSLLEGDSIADVDASGELTMADDFSGFAGDSIRVQASFESFTDEIEIPISQP